MAGLPLCEFCRTTEQVLLGRCFLAAAPWFFFLRRELAGVYSQLLGRLN
jgi:hypothetical protein